MADQLAGLDDEFAAEAVARLDAHAAPADGLGLDSLAALEVAVAVQQRFGFKIEKLDRDFFETNCSTVSALTRYVASRLS